MRRISFGFALVLAAIPAAAGCGAADDSGSCGGKCDSIGAFSSQLEGRNDPIAAWLRSIDVDVLGTASFDYGGVVAGVADVQKCELDSWTSFVISDPLVEGEVFPRVISTVCSDDATKASEFFIAASFKHPKKDDIDAHRLEMFAWDDDAATYRFYATEPVGGDRVAIEVEPQECRGCHLTPTNLPNDGMRMTPIMNELTQPWSHWSSEVPMFSGDGIPFRSHDFSVPEAVVDADDFVRYGRERIGAAQELETIIRAGHAKVALQRVKTRRVRREDWGPAMNLLRPLFCAEQINYSTEDFDSGKLHVTTVIPGGIREAYREVRADNWPWGWFGNDDGRLRLPAADIVSPLAMIPTRGNADVTYESLLVGGKALTPHQILRIRALDWKRPVFSELRCNLWREAASRLAIDPPEIDSDNPRDLARMRVLYDYIMQVDGMPLAAGEPETLIAIDLADDSTTSELETLLGDGDIDTAECAEDGSGICAVDLDTFGDMLDVHVGWFEEGDPDEVRRELRTMRDRRLCRVEQFFPNAPALPEVSCEDADEDGDDGFAEHSDVDAAIPDDDPSGLQSGIEVDASFEVATVQVVLDVEHTWRGDLEVTLTSPGGTTEEVVSLSRSDSGDDVVGRFDVSGFEGGDAVGTWTLSIVDRAFRDTGTLRSWSLGLNQPAPSAQP